jgi:hypothetical protein
MVINVGQCYPILHVSDHSEVTNMGHVNGTPRARAITQMTNTGEQNSLKDKCEFMPAIFIQEEKTTYFSG